MDVGSLPSNRSEGHFANGAEWISALGGVPLSRVIFSPWPGSATESDLLRIVDSEKRLCELVDGTLVEKPVGYWEALIALRLGALLSLFADKHKLGVVSGADTTLRMNSGRIRLPDVSFISFARLPKTRDPIPSLAPDLAVEVLSDGNTPDEISQKLTEYFQSGTRLAWIIDPRRQIVAVYDNVDAPSIELHANESLTGGSVLPGLSIPIEDLFRNIPKS
jgi:Uma2 family endonuclease